MATVNERRQMARGTAAEWSSANPVLLAGERGYETDTGREKIGDGTTPYNDLPWHRVKEYATVAELLASTEGPRGAGATWKAGIHTYREAANNAAAHLKTTDGWPAPLIVVPESEGVYNVLAFGEDPRGTTNDAALLVQAAANVVAPTDRSGWTDLAGAPSDPLGAVYFPAGHYLFATKVSAPSKVKFFGDWNGAVLELASDSVDDVLFELTGAATQPDYYVGGNIENLRMFTEKTTDCAAIRPASAVGNTVSSKFRHLIINGFRRGIDIWPSYGQFITVYDILTEGLTEQAVRMTGNINMIQMIERGIPGGTVPSNGIPYILVTPHDGNGGAAEGGTIGGTAGTWSTLIEKVLIQQTTDSGQTMIRAERANSVIIRFAWEEVSDYNYILSFQECTDCEIDRLNLVKQADNMIRLDNSHVTIKRIDDGGRAPWWKRFEVVGGSSVHVCELASPFSPSVFPVEEVAFSVDRIVRSSLTTLSDVPSVLKSPVSGPICNLAVNGNFSAETFGWDINGDLSVTMENSPFPYGNVLSMTGNSSGVKPIVQRLTITSEMVGKPLTLSVTGKISGGSTGRMGALFNGAGASNYVTVSQFEPEEGWATISSTYAPTTTGTLEFGAFVQNPTSGEIYQIASIALQTGVEHAPISPTIGSLQLQSAGSSGAVAAGPVFLAGEGSPEGVVAAGKGSIYARVDGGANSSIYVKENGSGNTGWSAMKSAREFGFELITNGGFDTDSDWTKGDGWSIAGGVATCVAAGGFRTISQASLGLDQSKTYRVTFDVTATVGTLSGVRFGAGVTSISGSENIGAGSYSFDVQPAGANNTIQFTSNPTFEGTIDNVSVKEVL